jgi:glycosyltransferase involved in cell wall biosynthesis
VRILHLVNHIQIVGNGIVNVAVDLACLQAASGATVAVASAGGDFDGLLARNAVKLINFDQRTTNPGSMLSLPARWKKIIREFHPDIVHAHMVAGAVIARTLRGSGDYRLVTTVHNEHESKARLMALGERVITVSKSNLDSMVRRGVARAKLRVVVNGTLGSPRARALPDNAETLHHPAILTVAGMYERKGISDLMLAFERIAAANPDAHLYIAGDGPDRGKFEILAKTLKSKARIHFLGFREQPQALMRSADVFVLASRREPFGLVITEAMEVGCPVVGSDVDGIPEILGRDGQFGLLVPPSNPEKLADAIERVLSSTPERARLAEASRERAKAFAVQRVVAETETVYRELLDPEIADRIEPDVNLNISQPARELVESAMAFREGELL